MDRLGIEFLSVLGLSPVELVRVAAGLGCRNISSAFSGSSVNPEGHALYNLATEAEIRNEMVAAMRDLDVSISLGEGFTVAPGRDILDRKGDFEIWRELGVDRVNIVSMDPDLERTLDQYAIFAQMAFEQGMNQVVAEFAPVLTINNLQTALRAVDHVGHPDFKLLIDTMHFGRTGGTAEMLRQVAPKIGYVQLCDVPVVPVILDYMEEAMAERLPPGQGELPLHDYLAAVPRDIIVSLEVPQAHLARQGVGPSERLAPALRAARALVAGLPNASISS